MNKILFVLAGACAVVLASCSNGSDTADVSIDEIAMESSSSLDPASSGSADSTDNGNGSDTTSAVNWVKDSAFTLSGHINVGRIVPGTPVYVLVLDSNLNELDSLHFAGAVQDSSGLYKIPDVILSSPYVSVGMSTRTFALCDEDDNPQANNNVTVELLLDLRSAAGTNINMLTTLQAARMKSLVKGGASFAKAKQESYEELREIFLMDSLDSKFEQLNYVDNPEENFYLQGADVMSFQRIWRSLKTNDPIDTLDDRTLSDFWYGAFQKINGNECFKMEQHTKSWKLNVLVGKTKAYLKTVTDTKYGFGDCSDDNYGEVKRPKYITDTLTTNRYFCNREHKWTSIYSSNCYTVDMMWLDTLPGKMGDMVKGKYCTEKTYKYVESWKEASTVDVGLKVACTPEKDNLVMSSGRKCYRCSGYDSRWLEPSESVLDCDTVLHACEKDGEEFKGTIHTDRNYVCDGNKARAFNNREASLKASCTKATEKKTFVVDSSLFTCDAGVWSFGTGDSTKNTILDKRDSNVYRVEWFGQKRWMVQNLNYIDSVGTPNLVGNVYRVGHLAVPLYTWAGAMNVKGEVKPDSVDPRGICPEGFHIPRSAEWDSLTAFVEKYRLAENVTYSLIDKYNFNVELIGKDKVFDEFGFTLPGDGLITSGGSHTRQSKEALLWTSSMMDGKRSIFQVKIDLPEPTYTLSALDSVAVSVRCVQD